MRIIYLFLALVCPLQSFAVHLRTGYTCKSKNLELDYDGPGSNYAVGGFSNFYIMPGKKNSVMASEYLDSEGAPNSITDKVHGDKIDDDYILSVIFSSDSKNIGKISYDKKPGDKCEPDDSDYLHSEWKDISTLKITDISKDASEKLHLHSGDSIKFECDRTEDMPITCPKSGLYTKKDLGL